MHNIEFVQQACSPIVDIESGRGIMQLMQLAGHCPAPESSDQPMAPQQIITSFQKECRDVRRGIDGDLTKVQLKRLSQSHLHVAMCPAQGSSSRQGGCEACWV